MAQSGNAVRTIARFFRTFHAHVPLSTPTRACRLDYQADVAVDHGIRSKRHQENSGAYGRRQPARIQNQQFRVRQIATGIDCE